MANEAAAGRGLRVLAPPDLTDFLCDYYLEAEGCWYFFPTDRIKIPAEQWHLHKFAIAVAKSGQLNFAYDFRDDELKMHEYLAAFSLYSLGRLDQAKAAMDEFQRKYPPQ